MPAFHDLSSDEEEEVVRTEALTEFSSTTLRKSEAPQKIIPKLQNTFRNGGLRYTPGILQKKEETKSIAELEAAEKRNNVYGLSRATTRKFEPESNVPQIKQELEEQKLTDQERAIQELINPTKQEIDRKIELQGTNQISVKPDRTQNHPDMSTIDDYEQMPVEDYGLAMLRGMGYVPDNGQKDRNEIKRRPDFLGLGATQRPEDSISKVDMQKKKYQKRKEERVYTPVVLKNKRTGEVITEVELEVQRAEQDKQIKSQRNDQHESNNGARRDDRSRSYRSDHDRTARGSNRRSTRDRSRDRSDRHYRPRRRSRSR